MIYFHKLWTFKSKQWRVLMWMNCLWCCSEIKRNLFSLFVRLCRCYTEFAQSWICFGWKAKILHFDRTKHDFRNNAMHTIIFASHFLWICVFVLKSHLPLFYSLFMRDMYVRNKKRARRFFENICHFVPVPVSYKIWTAVRIMAKWNEPNCLSAILKLSTYHLAFSYVDFPFGEHNIRFNIRTPIYSFSGFFFLVFLYANNMEIYSIFFAYSIYFLCIWFDWWLWYLASAVLFIVNARGKCFQFAAS